VLYKFAITYFFIISSKYYREFNAVEIRKDSTPETTMKSNSLVFHPVFLSLYEM